MDQATQDTSADASYVDSIVQAFQTSSQPDAIANNSKTSADKPADAANKNPDQPADKKVDTGLLPDPDLNQVDPPKDAAQVDDVPKNLSPQAATDWKSLKSAKLAVEAELSTLRKEIETYKKGGNTVPDALKKELEDIRKERDTMAATLKEVAVERHPNFKAYFEQKFGAVETAVKGAFGVKAADALAIIAMPEGAAKKQAYSEFVADLNEYDKGELAVLNRDWRAASAERQTEINRAAQSYETLQKTEGAKGEQARAARAQEQESAFGSALESWKKTASSIYGEREGDEAHNAGVRARVAVAKTIFSGENLDVAQAAKASMWAAAGPELAAQVKGLQQQMDALRKENAALKAAQPGTRGGNTAVAQPDGGKDEDDFVTSVTKAASMSGLLGRH